MPRRKRCRTTTHAIYDRQVTSPIAPDRSATSGRARLSPRTRSLRAAFATLFAIALWSAPLPTRAQLGSALIAASGAIDTRSLAAATPPDAKVVARTIAKRVRKFRAFRAESAHGVFRSEPTSVWRVRSSSRCLASLAKLGVPFARLERELATPVPAPVVLRGAVAGVVFRPVQQDREIELSCEFAARLPALARLLREHGVRTVHVNSSYRDRPHVSFHTFGLALDIAAFDTRAGQLVVARDYELAPDRPTCSATPTSERGRALQAIACSLAASGLFSTVITPNYNEGHHDHFHLDARPADPALFVR